MSYVDGYVLAIQKKHLKAYRRMAVMGRVTPDVWMKHATGSPVGPEALLSATEKALTQVSAEVLR